VAVALAGLQTNNYTGTSSLNFQNRPGALSFFLTNSIKALKAEALKAGMHVLLVNITIRQ